ncbi:MAG: hypothetical protein HKN95_10525 [Acidimicrobiia bacterium]|nr:hypothetical protein [Acidimicrobiia bacterium]
MPGEFFFMSMGGLGMSLAGFGGLLAALTPKKAAASAVTKWRITHIVIWGLHLTIIGFGVVAVYSIVEDAAMTARIMSGAAILVHVLRLWEVRTPGPAFRNETELRQNRWGTVAIILFLAVNVALGSVGYLHVIVLVMFGGPAGIFASGVKEIFDDAYRESKETRT